VAEMNTHTPSPRVLGGRYEVGELIGRGGMAEVHIGHDTRLGRTVAIKILRSDLARDPAFQARFQREAQSAASLNYPAIVAVYDSGEDTYVDPTTGENVHVPYIVMEYVEGHTVREILNHGDAVPIDEAVEITAGVLSALDYSHHAGIIHRDIKPGNVMITPTGAVKVMDFGIARAVADSAATMTQTQAVIGTAQYLSPEQARGETVDARSDIYSTGCLLFELLTGRPPFVGDSPVAVAYQHVGQAPVAPSDLAADVPPDLDRITLKALAKERSQRYATAAEMRADLEAFLAGQAVSASVIHPVVPGVGATQVFHPGVGATQVFQPGHPPLGHAPLGHGVSAQGGIGQGAVAPTQHIGAIAGPVVTGVGAVGVGAAGLAPGGPATAVYHPGQYPPPAFGEHPEAHPPAPHWGPLSQTPDHLPPVHDVEPLPEHSNRGKVLLWTLIPLGILLAGLAAFFIFRGGGPVEEPGVLVAVPTFTEGVTQAEACAQLELVHLVCEPLIDGQSNAPEGTFLRQDPAGTIQVEEGTHVTLWFSGGPSTLAMPGLEGFTVDRAREALEALGLHVSEVVPETSIAIPAGDVTRSQPGAGLAVQRGQNVVLYVSNGLVDLPDLTGYNQAQAISQLNALHLTNVIVKQASETVTPGTVISHSPVAGEVNQNSQVTLTVAEAPAPALVYVPNVAGTQCPAAEQNLRDAGFAATGRPEGSTTVLPGIALRTEPGEGSQQPAGSTVVVVCSSGPGPAMCTLPGLTDVPASDDRCTPCQYNPNIAAGDANCVPPTTEPPPDGRNAASVDRSGLARDTGTGAGSSSAPNATPTATPSAAPSVTPSTAPAVVPTASPSTMPGTAPADPYVVPAAKPAFVPSGLSR